ncbi:hypothetical protein [Simkania sp.]|uniref:hypothetical protein n=1 Tax=Simkania sp. TaxID=34094 RepID=UPI003B519B30
MQQIGFEYGFRYGTLGVLANVIALGAVNRSFLHLNKNPGGNIVPLAGGIAGAVFGGILPHAHSVRKPLQSMGVNRDVQDLIHLITQLAVPIIVSMATCAVIEKVGRLFTAINAIPETVGSMQLSSGNLASYLLFDIALFSLDLMSTHRWKDIKNVILKNMNPQ